MPSKPGKKPPTAINRELKMAMAKQPDVVRWDEERMGRLCLESIRALHQPPERFRISLRQYPVGVSFSGVSRAAHHYLLSGCCSFTVGSVTWKLEAGDIGLIPGGDFDFQVLGNDPVEFVSVWQLPPEFGVLDGDKR